MIFKKDPRVDLRNTFRVEISVYNMTSQDNFKKLKSAVLKKTPVLAEIIREQGSKSLYDYAIGFLDVNLNDPILFRQHELIEVFKSEVERNLGKEIAQDAAKQLAQYYFVSTADHHGPICHPYFLNSNLVTTIACLESPDPILKNIISFSCANVSFSNSSFPRGLFFTSFANGVPKELQLGFFPNSSEVRYSRVYNYKPYTLESIKKMKNRLLEMGRKRELYEKEADKIAQLFDEIYSSRDVLACKSFSDQMTKTNYLLWKKLFKHNGKTPNLLYIELESLVIQLLIKYHLQNDTVINRIIFNPEYQLLFIKYFDGINGGFSIKEKWGTYLFWALPRDQKYCKQLWREGDELVTSDKSYRVKLTPDAIKRALENKELIPSTQMSLILLALYYGLKCLGGFCQVNYLTQMKGAYIKMQVDHEHYKSIEVCARAQTKELGEDLSIAFLGGAGNDLTLASTLDLLLYGNGDTWPCLVARAREIKLEEALDPMMSEFYHVLYPEKMRDKDLAAISAQDIMKLTGLDQKIKACARV